ncbi:hypothetical protein CORC01_07382 [Colletotrichum orchidophilum]|uniref:BTB domain-containing protein n=1 Tax=Colletotrichum orchidophilum TaxID=1209926 RepID=A0A1G4B7D9_9PEZI|nr:uncharacterized protein CORC01_07382 [Colletotrichum orchidophilum]OHE97327.1 hypothetical protein CORC01_07382 [Colletotrichum orchidophilum]
MASSTRGIPDLEGVLTSRVITFVIGQDRKLFKIYEKLVASRSAIFDRMLTKGWRESVEGVVGIDDVEPEVFTSFIKFAFYGNYDVPTVSKFQETAKNGETESDDAQLIQGESYDSLLDHLTKQDAVLCRNQPYLRYLMHFTDQGVPGKLYCMPSGVPWNQEDDLEANFDLLVANRLFGEICTHHVKLYIFADKYDIAQLREVCLHRLHSSLTRARLGNPGYQLLFGVIEFAFANTIPGDKIRKLLVQTCVADFSMVRAMPCFSDLLQRVPELGFEIMTELPRYSEEKHKAIWDVDSKFPPV